MRAYTFHLGLAIQLATIVLLTSCTSDQIAYSTVLDHELNQALSRTALDGTAEYYMLPDENDLSNIPQDPQNPLTKEKVELGKFLFFETGLALDANHVSGLGTYSCATCHLPEKGFRPDNVQGIADGGIGYAENRRIDPNYEEDELDVQEARPLSLINVAFVSNTSWNGSFGAYGANVGTEDVWDELEETNRNFLGMSGLETQNIQGMITHRMVVDKTITDNFGYTELFDTSFPEIEEAERYSIVTASFAISAYLRTVLANRAPFQDWLRGDKSAMTDAEKAGGILFFGKANCNRCHYRQNLGSEEFHALGVKDMDQHPASVKADNPTARRNLGRGGFTMNEEDYYKYKVPGIYNIADADHFFHGSSITTLEGLIEYKNLAVKENDRVTDTNMSSKFEPLNLSETEKEQLLTFVEKSLSDPDITRYTPDHVLSGNCFPNNDVESKDFLNCE